MNPTVLSTKINWLKKKHNSEKNNNSKNKRCALSYSALKKQIIFNDSLEQLIVKPLIIPSHQYNYVNQCIESFLEFSVCSGYPCFVISLLICAVFYIHTEWFASEMNVMKKKRINCRRLNEEEQSKERGSIFAMVKSPRAKTQFIQFVFL